MLKSFLITGASGFVGVNLENYLHSYSIQPVSIRYTLNRNIEMISDVVFHLAGKTHDSKKASQPKDYYESNYELTKQLFNAFLFSVASVFIFMSILKAVADGIEETLTEDVIPNPKAHYSIARKRPEYNILVRKFQKEKEFTYSDHA